MAERSPGFTLLEFMLALGIFGAVAVSVAGALRAGVDVWRRADAVARRNQEARRVLEDFGRDLRNAISFPGETFEGTSDGVVLHLEREGEIWRIEYRADAAAGALTRTVAGYGKENRKERVRRLTSSPSSAVFEFPKLP